MVGCLPGYRYVDPNDGATGFPPHRDRQPDDSPATFRPDGSAMWVPQGGYTSQPVAWLDEELCCCEGSAAIVLSSSGCVSTQHRPLRVCVAGVTSPVNIEVHAVHCTAMVLYTAPCTATVHS